MAAWVLPELDRWPIHPHLLFETLAYVLGFACYRLLRRRGGDFLADEARWSMIVAVVLGAAVGSKLLHHLSHPIELAQRWREPAFVMGGKTIVGALLGGWMAVEWTKKRLGVTRATGDLYAVPLVIGMVVGRLGCFFGGAVDGTSGLASALPWAVDFGDGVGRHPTQLYEIVFLMGLGVFLLQGAPERKEGRAFRVFLQSYLAFRLAVDFLKPAERLLGLSGIQWAALGGIAWYATARLRTSSGERTLSEGVRT